MSEPIPLKLVDNLIQLDTKKEADYAKDISQLLDEEPYLMGFLFNLADDFSEQGHELLLRATLALRQSLAHSGLFFKMISPSVLEETLKLQVQAFEELQGDNETIDEETIYTHASSPVVLRELKNFITQNTFDAAPDEQTDESLLLILSTVIEVLEKSASPENTETEID
jgi:hypothetical protein